FRVRQILVNLMNNAIKFTDAGTVRLDVSVENGPARRALVFAVTDTGVGIAPEHEGTLFRAFTQIGRADTDRAGGAGLGPPISKELARLLNGDLVFERPPGCGSRFVLTIDPGPLDGVPAVHEPPPRRDIAMRSAARARLAGRVLVAEDDPDTRGL